MERWSYQPTNTSHAWFTVTPGEEEVSQMLVAWHSAFGVRLRRSRRRRSRDDHIPWYRSDHPPRRVKFGRGEQPEFDGGRLVSKWENGPATAPPDRVDEIAQCLDYPSALFCQPKRFRQATESISIIGRGSRCQASLGPDALDSASIYPASATRRRSGLVNGP